MQRSIKHREGGALSGAIENRTGIEPVTLFDVDSGESLNRTANLLECERGEMALFEKLLPGKEGIEHGSVRIQSPLLFDKEGCAGLIRLVS
jgi:hypothetical protein